MTRPTETARIRMNPFDRLWAEVGNDVLDATRRVGASGWYVLGSEVRWFEEAFAAYCEAPTAVGVASGLDAIEIGLRCLGLQRGEPVLTTPLTAFATTLAIIRAGGVPEFVDVNQYGTLDVERCGVLLENRGDIRFCVPVHLYGQSMDLPSLRALKEKFGLKVVEDAAQSHGASFRGQRVGTVGEVTAYSFYPTKNLGALGDAGALTCSTEQLAARARALRNYGQVAHYVHEELGLNSRLDELQAAILADALLPRLASWTERRQAIARRYRETLVGSALKPVPVTDPDGCVYHLFPVRVKKGGRDAFREFMSDGGIDSGVHYPSLVSAQSALADAYEDFEAPVARAIAEEEVSLPIHPLLTDDEVRRVIDRCLAWEALHER